MEQNNPMINQQKPEFTVLTDLVRLPSNGWYYEDGKCEVFCEYMTAKDEQILLTPELLKKGNAFDVLLSRKIKDKGIVPENLLVGDQNAILMFLRCTAYGNQYEVRMVSPFTMEEYNEIVDLSKLTNKEVKMPDSDKLHTYTTKDGKHSIRFKILTAKEENMVQNKAESNKKISAGVNEVITERLKYQIVSLDGNNDTRRIHDWVNTMRPSLSKEIRKYIDEVTPGLDMDYEFMCPFTGQPFQTAIPITSKFFYPES